MINKFLQSAVDKHNQKLKRHLEKIKNEYEEHSKKIKEEADKLKIEYKKHILTAIVAAFSFLLALSWREVITTYIGKLQSVSLFQGQFISAIIITIISVLGIIIANKFLGVKTIPTT